jgi:hypothetical protein
MGFIQSTLALKFQPFITILMTFRISGLIKSSQQFQKEIYSICSCQQKDLSFSNPQVIRLHEQVSNSFNEIETQCLKHKASPADLPNPSYLIYQWLRFLSKRKWLLSHLYGLAEFQDVLKSLGNSTFSRINPKHVQIEIKNFNFLFRCKQKRQAITLEINESFINSPRTIKELIVQSAIGGKSNKKNQILKDFTADPRYKKISQQIQDENQKNLITYQGYFYNLNDIFQKLNLHYFEGKLDRSRLNWSSKQSKRRLGYYHPEKDQITISRSLDSKTVQPLLVEFILYHEMLHKFLGIRETNGRRYAHTGEFKKKEKSFINYQEAVQLMHQFCR